MEVGEGGDCSITCGKGVCDRDKVWRRIKEGGEARPEAELLEATISHQNVSEGKQEKPNVSFHPFLQTFKIKYCFVIYEKVNSVKLPQFIPVNCQL